MKKQTNQKAILFDFMRTIYDPSTEALLPGAEALLSYCADKYDCYLISHNEGHRQELFDALRIRDHFKSIHLVDQKTEATFIKCLNGKDYTEVYVVGDRLQGEIWIGNRLKFVTIWLKRGKFETETPRSNEEIPTHTILDLQELKEIL